MCLTLTHDAKLPLFSPGLYVGGGRGSLLGFPQEDSLLNTQASHNWVCVQLALSGTALVYVGYEIYSWNIQIQCHPAPH